MHEAFRLQGKLHETGRLRWFGALLLLAVSCNLNDEDLSFDSHFVVYAEQQADGFLVVRWFPDRDCEIHVMTGPTSNDIDGIVAHCNATECSELGGMQPLGCAHKKNAYIVANPSQCRLRRQGGDPSEARNLGRSRPFQVPSTRVWSNR
jgi:hypothetical protein